MVDELHQALRELDRAGALPEEAQRQIAVIIEEELEQREWDALVSSPKSKEFLKRLIAEAMAGEIEEGGWEVSGMLEASTKLVQSGTPTLPMLQ